MTSSAIMWARKENSTQLVFKRFICIIRIAGRRLRYALDRKVRRLRSLLTADDDITTELDRVVCRLLKLALRTSKGHQNPPPTRWLQCKLLDLLTLTEKTIDRRRKRFIESYPLTAISYDPEPKSDMIKKLPVCEKIKEDDTAIKIVDKYQHFLQPSDTVQKEEGTLGMEHQYVDFDLEDESVISVELLRDFQYVDNTSPSIDHKFIINKTVDENEITDQDESKFERVRNWIVEDVEVVPYPKHSNNYDISSGDTDHSPGLDDRTKTKKAHKKFKSVTVAKNEKDFNIRNANKNKATRSKQFGNYERKFKSKIKSTNTRVIKKSVRKMPSYSLLNNDNNKKNCEVQSKKKKEYLQILPSKPIPESLIELSQLDVNGNKYCDNYKLSDGVNNISELINTPTHISATEESFFIDIVTEDKEETIALRRSVGTDVDSFDSDAEFLIQCINHETSEKVSEKCEDGTENAQSQTIFLNDINEPSTSKGIRHISMDVQCGPDNTGEAFSMLSATTSYNKLPTAIETGVKIDDLYTDFYVNNKNFGTSTDDCEIFGIVNPNIKSVGIWIRDSDPILPENVTRATQEIKNREVMASVALVQHVSKETKLLKIVSSNMKIEDSSSEFCGSISSRPKSPFNYTNLSGSNDSQMIITSNRKAPVLYKLSSTKYIKPKLGCGGVHIHSYKDQYTSEDIVYQGEWQRHRKSLVKKKSLMSALKRVVNPNVKRHNLSTKNKNLTVIPDQKEESNKSKNTITSIRNFNSVTKEKENKIDKSSRTALNNCKTKITSKHIVACAFSSKPHKLTSAPKKPLTLPTVPVNRDLLPKQRLLAQNYIPSYLKKRRAKITGNNKDNLNDSIDTVQTTHDEKKTPSHTSTLAKLKTEEITSGLLKFHPKAGECINYLVFRNEIDSKKSKSSENTGRNEECTTIKGNFNHRSQSPESQNSSTCSTPNSIATIRQVTKKLKSVSMRKTPTSSQKSNIDDSGSETSTPTKVKKNVKRGICCKNTKKLDKKQIENKENLSENTKTNLNKHCDKTNKCVYKSSQQNVFIAQIESESQVKQPLQPIVSNLCKHTPQNNNYKISPESVDLKSEMGSPSISRKRFLNSESVSHFDHDKYILNKSSFSAEFDLITEIQLAATPKIMQTIETNLNECVTTTNNVDNNNANAMREMLEELLCRCNDSFPNNRDIDSKTVLLSPKYSNKNHAQKSRVDEQNSLDASFQKNLVNDDIFNAVNISNRSLDTFEEVSVVSVADTYITVTDLDLLSFKSIASETKLSENFFDGCDFNIPSPKNNSVRELFERKDQPTVHLQIPGGALAVQAFSGFSLNGEPIAGDQPDPINMVDSETGSLALDFARQATSEELFVSGRSSTSYESCVIDEDAVVPTWLFNIISHQQPVMDDSDSMDLVIRLPMEGPIPLAEPVLDDNGNDVDPGVGAGAGAGDGRGIHSDHSQDSSGRDTSFSSSDTSSEQQNEAIIIDPSAFAEQHEGTGERSNIAVPVFPIAAAEPSGATGILEEYATSSSRYNREDQPRFPVSMGTSDVEADVSSLDTDVIDSSDN